MSIDTPEARARIERWFPAIAAAGYKIKSEIDHKYNCIAFAAGFKNKWWEAATGAGYFWPKGVSDDGSTAALVHVFESLGYATCENGVAEDGIEKVALYFDDDGYTHAAKQNGTDGWASKLGPYEDIEHVTNDSLCGDQPEQYGKLFCYMSRRVDYKATDATKPAVATPKKQRDADSARVRKSVGKSAKRKSKKSR